VDSRKRGFFWGAARLRHALALLRSHHELWIWCALPLLLNIAAFTLAILLFFNQWDAWTSFLGKLLSTADPTIWYQWLWVGPLRALAWLARWILPLAIFLAVYFLFTLVGGVVASPFLDVLSRRVEAIRTGTVQEAVANGVWGLVRASLRVVFEEGKRTLFFVGVQLGFLSIGWLPGLQPVAGAGSLGFTMLFLPLDYAGYILDRREIPFRERRRWLWAHRRSMVGFGGAALGTFFVPGLNFLCLPWLVTGATILALEVGIPGVRGAVDSAQTGT
jgi:CysZ protein